MIRIVWKKFGDHVPCGSMTEPRWRALPSSTSRNNLFVSSRCHDSQLSATQICPKNIPLTTSILWPSNEAGNRRFVPAAGTHQRPKRAGTEMMHPNLGVPRESHAGRRLSISSRLGQVSARLDSGHLQFPQFAHHNRPVSSWSVPVRSFSEPQSDSASPDPSVGPSYLRPKCQM